MDFCREESCGKCVPCRVGTRSCGCCSTRSRAARRPRPTSPRWSGSRDMVRRTSLCGLGQGAPNPIFSTLRYFRDEYLAHIVDRVCPAGVCPVARRRERGMSVLTLQIDGVDVAGHRGRVDPRRRDARTGSRSRRCATSAACPRRARAGCASSRSRARTACSRPARRAIAEGMRGHDEHRRGSTTTGGPIVEMLFLERQPRVLGLRREQPLRAAGPVGDRRHGPFRAAARSTRGSTIDASHPLFAIDHNRCIMCVRCVRVCAEVEGACTWGVMGSGIDERVVTDMGTPWGESATCTSCGKCVQVCPTGRCSRRVARSPRARKARRPFLPYLAAVRGDGR